MTSDRRFEEKAAIYLEEIGISGDTMIQLDMLELKGWMDLHDIIVGFATELQRESAKQEQAHQTIERVKCKK